MANQTTQRFLANKNAKFDSFDLALEDIYQYGCEFEFYIKKTLDFQATVLEIKDKILQFSNADILLDFVSLPSDVDKNQCIQIKPDHSLEDNGIEISVPITSKNGIKHYINNILKIIQEYGYTNDDTGLHFHISTIKNDGVNFDFYLYMLMCHDKDLFSSWATRNGYSHNVMDILSGNSKIASRNIKNHKGQIWNLEKISSNHVEIKSMGGIDYHLKKDQIILEFEQYAECFDIIHKKKNTKYREQLINNHKKIIENISVTQKEEFINIIYELGIIDE
ncbi:MAG: hypothetical protein GX118_06600 [Arcobacter butzleri]|jgi:hypothetical protein|nr:hypothetical protein [Arcobacteraceae bacterium]MDY0364365.1 hypothetical protein [Arcobacteraceae bacterium]NLO17842.1 hypothetical protein [Aliarcobacter butzleri]